MDLRLSEITNIIRTVLSKAERDHVNLENAWFWSVPLDDLTSINDGPPELTIGDAAETLELLRKCGDLPFSSSALVWAADLLKVLAASDELFSQDGG